MNADSEDKTSGIFAPGVYVCQQVELSGSFKQRQGGVWKTSGKNIWIVDQKEKEQKQRETNMLLTESLCKLVGVCPLSGWVRVWMVNVWISHHKTSTHSVKARLTSSSHKY